jgi:thiazole/oxazole-forming peptide maturase SagC family component
LINVEDENPRVMLATSVRMLAAELNVIRLRWGIWNFQEATIDLRAEPSHVQQAVGRFFSELAAGGTAHPGFIDEPALSAVEKANLRTMTKELRQAGFLSYDRPLDNGAEMARVLLGNLNLYGSEGGLNDRVGFVSDSATAVAYMETQAKALGVNVDPAPEGLMRTLHSADFTSGMGGLDAAADMALLQEMSSRYESLVVCISRASVHALRNLNRLVLAAAKPVVVGLIDGPFATILGADTPATGCLECFEQRSLARLEDHVGYHSFVRAGTVESVVRQANGVESLLCAFLMNEAALLGTAGVSRFIGRALSVYLPTYEMQAQDVLRIATCPACGHVAKDIASELNFSSRVVIDEGVRQALGVR